MSSRLCSYCLSGFSSPLFLLSVQLQSTPVLIVRPASVHPCSYCPSDFSRLASRPASRICEYAFTLPSHFPLQLFTQSTPPSPDPSHFPLWVFTPSTHPRPILRISHSGSLTCGGGITYPLGPLGGDNRPGAEQSSKKSGRSPDLLRRSGDR